MILYLFCLTFIFLNGCGRHHNTHRSPLRRTSACIPTIVVSEATYNNPYSRTSSAYQKYPIFTTFDYNFFIEHQIPPCGVSLANSHDIISYDIFNRILDNTVDAIIHNKKIIPECTIVRDANFNHQTGCGLLILKMDEYPFIIKLFRETAESFINPYGKGLEPITFFFMSGGCNRHIAGLTRIPNREYLVDIIQKDPLWREIVRIPRKWYWVPEQTEWLIINGYNVDTINTCLYTKIPSVYAVIADHIDTKEHHFLNAHTKQQLLMSLCTFCQLHLDPHIKNFIITQETPDTKPLITIVDTEDHQCMTGIGVVQSCSSYFEWYSLLIGKFLKNLLFKVKTGTV